MESGASLLCDGNINTMRTLSIWLLLCFLLSPFMVNAAYPQKYSAEAIEAWLVDAETKQLVEGAVVVAHWQLYGRVIESNPVGELKILLSFSFISSRIRTACDGMKCQETA
ncbi:MAG: hypothetical protein AABZ84_03445 [Pseudomonadota bacterium]